ncbi:type II secretion system protein [Enterococcus sp. BWB1-3]|uniref:type II secretion system protein n=1 Tax=unclassified Enterococcus TaxID=2608891 RepID=UPI0019223FBB|nr:MULTISPECIES: type II secretion system protein [unclassified Enterococcus]MBL1229156.1 type II secretion system protein [Enterococcus sp. BWB1-3]MCB5952536.1 type II secretion system protein [Enterococcus sp. BWT-B8]MCB5953422.1 type II secretion system protein [Enterococcus sp. CWB-B31]
MRKLLQDENGLSMFELIGAITIFGLASFLFSAILFSIFRASVLQGQQLELQQTANNLVAQMEGISKIENIYKDAGYRGKFNSDWSEAHIVKILAADKMSELLSIDQGDNPLYISDILDTSNQRASSYHVKDQNIKIKLIQQKNENEVTKTIYATPNYRDTFSIQTSGVILFYKEEIEFSDYYDSSAGLWALEQLLAENEASIVYSRKFVLTYRDDEKASGEVPGNGRW